MTQYAIMRCNKVKSVGQLSRTLKHNFREQDTPNADPERTDQNEHDGAERSTDAIGKIKQRLPEKRRKDAVIAIEYLMTASPEWMNKATDDQKREFFDKSKQWLIDKYGKENVVLSSIHRDESTEHMAAWVTPITKDGRLCAKDFIGGPAKLRADQTDYHKAVEGMGLERGKIGSKAKHERIQAYYSALQPQTQDKDIERERAPRIGENDIVRIGVMKKIDVDKTITGINQKISKRWSEQEMYRTYRSEEVQRATRVAKEAELDQKKWVAFRVRLEKMQKQGLTAPDGKPISNFLAEKMNESKGIEDQKREQQRQRMKDRGRGD